MRQETINGNVHTYDDAGRLITVCTASLVPQCDILSTTAEIKSDDAEVAALMMEVDIQAPNKERMAWLQNENERLEGMLKIYKEKLADEIARNNLLNKKAKQSDEYFVLLAQCLHDVKV